MELNFGSKKNDNQGMAGLQSKHLQDGPPSMVLLPAEAVAQREKAGAIRRALTINLFVLMGVAAVVAAATIFSGVAEAQLEDEKERGQVIASNYSKLMPVEEYYDTYDIQEEQAFVAAQSDVHLPVVARTIANATDDALRVNSMRFVLWEKCLGPEEGIAPKPAIGCVMLEGEATSDARVVDFLVALDREDVQGGKILESPRLKEVNQSSNDSGDGSKPYSFVMTVNFNENALMANQQPERFAGVLDDVENHDEVEVPDAELLEEVND